eukprot:28048_1
MSVTQQASSMVMGIPGPALLATVLGAAGFLLCAWAMCSQRSKRNRRGKEADMLKRNMWIETPLIKSEWLSSCMDQASIVNLKLEALQPSGSFKIRGISAFMKNEYGLHDRMNCFVTASASNTGMAVAYTASKLNCKCMVILAKSQRNNPLLPILENDYGAKVEFQGDTWTEAEAYANKLCANNSRMCYVPVFEDNPVILHGHSSIVSELKQQYDCGDGGLDDNYPDCVIVSVAGGERLNGVLSGLYQCGWSRDTQVVAAQSEGLSLFEAGVRNGFQPVAVKATTCDGEELGYRAISGKSMDLAEKFSAFKSIKSMVVKDADVLKVCSMFAEREHMVIDPLCGAAVTALFQNRDYLKQFKNICIIVCGGNRIYFDKKLAEAALEEMDAEETEESSDGSSYDSDMEEA